MSAEVLVIIEVTSTPGAISIVTSELTNPGTTFLTVPLSAEMVIVFQRIAKTSLKSENKSPEELGYSRIFL